MIILSNEVIYLLCLYGVQSPQKIQVIGEFCNPFAIIHKHEGVLIKLPYKWVSPMVKKSVIAFKEIIALLQQGVVACAVAVDVVFDYLAIVMGWPGIKVSDALLQKRIDIHVSCGKGTCITSHERVRSGMMNAWHSHLRQ